MKPKYKIAKVVMPHCPKCKQMLSGNNSYISPYKCECGVWHQDSLIDGEFVIYEESI